MYNPDNEGDLRPAPVRGQQNGKQEMSIAKLSHIISLFGGKELSEAERKDLFEETLLMTLAHATASDSNINPIEVDSVIRIVEGETGNSVSAADVRVAAKSDIYETASLDQYLDRASRSLEAVDRVRILEYLGQVIKSDVRISVLEVDFFNRVAAALKVTPADLVGLREAS